MLARRIIFAVSILLNMALFYALIWGGSGAISYRELRDQYDDLQERIRRAEDDNKALEREIGLLRSDDNYLEKVIRNRLNFVKENEILYIFPPGKHGENQGGRPHEAEN